MPTRVVSTPHPRRSAWWLAAACAGAIGYFTLSPAAGEPGTAFFCLVCGSRGGVDAVLNLLLFAPLGAALVLCGIRWPRAIIAMAVLSACIEATQFVAIPGRDATFGDIVMNTLGGSIGVAVAYWRFTLLRPAPRLATTLCWVWSALWLGIQLLVSFAFAPSLSATRYYGQIARSFSSMATFRGAVLDARIDTTLIPDRVVPGSVDIRALLAHNAIVSAVVIPDGETSRLAPILRIADRNREEIVILGQDRSAAIFGVRTGASELRVRPPLFRLPRALRAAPGPAVGDSDRTVRLSARYGRIVRMRAERSTTTLARDIPATVGLGWTLVLPAQWYIEGSTLEGFITALWLLASLAPLGFWIGCIRGMKATPIGVARRAIITLLVAALLAFGLALVPMRFGLAPESVLHWLAAAGGIVIGFVAAKALGARSARR